MRDRKKAKTEVGFSSTRIAKLRVFLGGLIGRCFAGDGGRRPVLGLSLLSTPPEKPGQIPSISLEAAAGSFCSTAFNSKWYYVSVGDAATSTGSIISPTATLS